MLLHSGLFKAKSRSAWPIPFRSSWILAFFGDSAAFVEAASVVEDTEGVGCNGFDMCFKTKDFARGGKHAAAHTTTINPAIFILNLKSECESFEYRVKQKPKVYSGSDQDQIQDSPVLRSVVTKTIEIQDTCPITKARLGQVLGLSCESENNYDMYQYPIAWARIMQSSVSFFGSFAVQEHQQNILLIRNLLPCRALNILCFEPSQIHNQGSFFHQLAPFL